MHRTSLILHALLLNFAYLRRIVTVGCPLFKSTVLRISARRPGIDVNARNRKLMSGFQKVPLPRADSCMESLASSEIPLMVRKWCGKGQTASAKPLMVLVQYLTQVNVSVCVVLRVR